MRPDVTVAELMTPDPITVRERTLLATVAAEMERSDVRHVPIVDASGAVVGILSDRDILRRVGRGLRGARAQDAMTEEVLSVRPDTLAHEAAALLLDRKIGALPVIDDAGKLVGIITEADFVRVAHRLLGGTA